MLWIISFDCSLNGLNARFCFKCFFDRVTLELVNQRLDCLFADVIVFLDSRMVQSLDP